MHTHTHMHMLNARWNSNAQPEEGLTGSPCEQLIDIHSELSSFQATWPVSKYRWWPDNLLRDIPNAFGHTLVARNPREHHIFIG